MKRMFYFVLAAIALVACESQNEANEKVRINVSLDDNAQPYKGQQRISVIDKGSIENENYVIDVTWEADDVLYWDKGDGINTDNPFKIVTVSDDKKNASFECEDGAFIDYKEPFTVYYQGNSTPNFNNDLVKNQIVTINQDGHVVINNDYLMYTANDCKVGSSIILQPNYAILGVNLIGDNAHLNAIAGHYAIIGAGKVGNQSVDLTCKLSGTIQGESIIYYFVYPYNGSAIDLQGKYLWFANNDGKEEKSNELQFERSVELTQGNATIINLYLTDYNSNPSTVDKTFTLSKTDSN